MTDRIEPDRIEPDRIKPDRKSVILVTVDSLRADHCGFMHYPHPTTPFLDGLAKQSFVFPTAIAAGVPTYYSFPAILASRYPLALGREVLGLAAGETSLASVFHHLGYKTAFFGAANPYLSAQFGYHSGFDQFSDFLNAPVSPNPAVTISGPVGTRLKKLNPVLATMSHRIPGLGAVYDELYFQYSQRYAAPADASLDGLRRFPSAAGVVDAAQTWIATVGDARFFLWLHLMDPHAPYYPTAEALKLSGNPAITASRARYVNASWNRFADGSPRLSHYRKEVVALYDAGIRWVDEQLSRLVGYLQRSQHWKNCVFALTADHGEEFLDHGGRYHPPSLAEELIHVPLLLRVPAREKRAVCANPFSLLHLAPTLLDAADASLPADFCGASVWPQLQSSSSWQGPAMVECVTGAPNFFGLNSAGGSRMLAVRDDRYKLVITFDRRGDVSSENLFDLEADPRERRPLPLEGNSRQRHRLLEPALLHLRHLHPLRNSDAYLRTRVGSIRNSFESHSNLSTPQHRALEFTTG